MANLNIRRIGQTLCHNFSMTRFRISLIAQQTYYIVLGKFYNFGEIIFCRFGRDLARIYFAKSIQVASPCRFSAFLWVSQSFQMDIFDTDIFKRRSQNIF